MDFQENENYCPFDTAWSLICGKYKQRIMWLLIDRKLRFSELQRMVPNITTKVLTQQLRMLEEDKLITRTVYPEVPIKTEYELTEMGMKAKPILMAVRDFGEQYLNEHEKPCGCPACENNYSETITLLPKHR